MGEMMEKQCRNRLAGSVAKLGTGLAMLACLGSSLLGSSLVHAGPFGGIETLNQNQFRELSETLGAATHYKGLTSAETLGILGFDVAVELSSTSIDKDLFDQATDGDYDYDTLLIPRIHAHKGLQSGSHYRFEYFRW